MKKTLVSMVLASTLMLSNAGSQVNAQENNKMKGTILYVDVDDSGKTYLTSMNPDGTEKKHITPAFNSISFPRYNKKSGWIGFTNKTSDMKSEIYLMNKNKVRRILTGVNLEDFSPDGKTLLYTTCDKKASLYAYNIANKRATKLSEEFKVVSARWSQDGEWIIASIMRDDGETDMILISTLAQGIKRITNTQGISESFPSFVEGSYIVYTTNAGGDYTIEFLDMSVPRIFKTNLMGLFPVMSPDNDWFAYESNNKIVVAHKTGRDPKAIAKGKTPLWIEK